MKKGSLAGFIAFVLLFGVACENTAKREDSVEVAEEANEHKMENTPAGDEKDDQAEFMVEAASGGMMEVTLGKMAASQATNAEVKAFGQMMVTDHTKANEELKTLAAAKNVTLPDIIGDEHQNHIDKLSKLRGAEFDRAYMSHMVEDHEEDIEHFKEAANDNDYDAEVKAFASKTLPVLEKHLQRAKEVNDKVKNAK